VVAGGIAATKDRCTDWDPDEVWDYGVSVFQSWIEGRGSLAAADEERAVQQVRSLIASNLAKFVDIIGDTKPIRDQLGYRKRVDEAGKQVICFLIWPDIWAATFCKGLDPQFTARTLHDRRFLTTDPGRLQYSCRTPDFDRPKKFYAVKETILLEGDEKIAENRDE